MRFLKYIWEVNPRDERKFCGYEIEDLWEEVLQTLDYKGERNFRVNPDGAEKVVSYKLRSYRLRGFLFPNFS